MHRSWWLIALVGVACYVEPRRDLCNGVDDDRDVETADGSDEPWLGKSCDGEDGDVCTSGSLVCFNGVMTCNDAASDAVEICNGTDDDCNGAVDEGFQLATDAANCGACGHVCKNPNGTSVCEASQCIPTCFTGATDCNGIKDDGCEVFRDRNPTCVDAPAVAAISGDTAGTGKDFTGTDEAIFIVRITEDSSIQSDPSATITLESPPGVNFDLEVGCVSCNGALVGSSTLGAGMTDTVVYRKVDVPNVTDSRDIIIYVRYVSATGCAPWKIKVVGNTGGGAPVCS